MLTFLATHDYIIRFIIWSYIHIYNPILVNRKFTKHANPNNITSTLYYIFGQLLYLDIYSIKYIE